MAASSARRSRAASTLGSLAQRVRRATGLVVDGHPGQAFDEAAPTAAMSARAEQGVVPPERPLEVSLGFELAPLEDRPPAKRPEGFGRGNRGLEGDGGEVGVEGVGPTGPLSPEIEGLAGSFEPLAPRRGRGGPVAGVFLGGFFGQDRGGPAVEHVGVGFVRNGPDEGLDVEGVADVGQADEARRPPGQERRRAGQRQGAEGQDESADPAGFGLVGQRLSPSGQGIGL